MNAAAPLRIVCFGDSLTDGFQSPTRENPQGRSSPYGGWLREWMGESGDVSVTGICGELTAEMVHRFRRDALAGAPQYVVILGGTNDLGWNGAVADILRNLVTMYEQAHAAGSVPVPVTVPSLRVEGMEGSPDAEAWVRGHLDRRRELNGHILHYAADRGLPLIDLFTATAEPGTHLLAHEYSNDGLHLTTAGYRLFAELVWKQILQPVLSQAAKP